jgi:heme/copper-type cytochrome/quinol oxidase subunit 3
MKISLNTVILLSGVAFITGIARLMLEVRFVTEIVNAMPEDQPAQTALVMLPFILLFSGWLWALLSATRNHRRGLIGLLIFNLILALAWGGGTVVSFCPTPCFVAPPLTDIVTWMNVIVGFIAAAAVGIYLRSFE